MRFLLIAAILAASVTDATLHKKDKEKEKEGKGCTAIYNPPAVSYDSYPYPAPYMEAPKQVYNPPPHHYQEQRSISKPEYKLAYVVEYVPSYPDQHSDQHAAYHQYPQQPNY